MKSKILAIVGPSGCGKTSMAEYLKETLNIPVIVSYTTRAMRDGEVDGVEHLFVSDEDIPPRSEMLAYTKFGECHYWSLLSQVPKQGACSYVIDEKGLVELTDKYGDMFDVVPILIKRNIDKLRLNIDAERLKRDEERVSIEESRYTAVIENNGTLEDFYNQLLLTIKNIL